MNYAYARVSAKDRTYSGRLPRLVSNGAELRYAPRERAPRALFSLPRLHLTDDPRSPRVILHNYTINFSAHFLHFYSLILRRTGQSLLPPA